MSEQATASISHSDLTFHEAHDPRNAGDACIEAVVHRGHLANVYRGELQGAPVAIKVYESGLASSEWRKRLKRETDAQSRSHHPSVARLVDSGQTPDGRVYLTSAWVEGESLADRLLMRPLTWLQFAPILSAVGHGLKAIHDAEVVHRDLKPANIMLPASGDPAAVILDFGHSLVLDEARLTDTGRVLGTASYMSPEQARGNPLDARSDLYTLGVVAYECLTGTLPFRSVSPAEVMTMHQNVPVEPPRMRAPNLNIAQSAEDLCLWLLTKDPQERLASARVLSLTIASVLAGEEKVA